MGSLRDRIDGYGWRRIGQSTVVVAFLVFAIGIMGMWRLLAFVGSVWFDNFLGLVDPAEFGIHRVHDVAFATIVWTIVLGMVAQLKAPREHVGGMAMALVPLVALPIAFALSGFWEMAPMVGIIGAFVVVATLLHPAGRDLVGWVSGPRVSYLLLALVVIAAVPMLTFAVGQADLQSADQADLEEGSASAAEHEAHAEVGHYMIMAAFAFVVLGTGLLACLRPPDWWIPASVTAIAVVVNGLAWIVYPEYASSPGTTWGLAAIAWGIGFGVAATLTQYTDSPASYGTPDDAAAAER